MLSDDRAQNETLIFYLVGKLPAVTSHCGEIMAIAALTHNGKLLHLVTQRGRADEHTFVQS